MGMVGSNREKVRKERKAGEVMDREWEQQGRMPETDTFTVRLMREEELGQAAELERFCFSQPWSLKLLKDSYAGSWDTFFAVERQGILWGYAILRVIAGEGEIQRIAVHPRMRRVGIGSKLMEAMDAFSSTCKVGDTTLEVRAGNIGAISLYKSYGFVEEGLRRDYYRNPTEDAVIMWKRRP